MIKLYVDNIYTKIECEEEYDRYIARLFKIPLPKGDMTDNRTHEWFYDRVTKLLPTGLLHILLKDLNEESISYELVDTRKIPEKAEFENPVLKLGRFDLSEYPYDYQGESVKVGLEKHRGIFEIATNGGKTTVAASLIASLKVPTLFLVGGTDLLSQAERAFKKMLGRRVYVFGGGKKELGDLTVATIQTINANFAKRSNMLQDFDMVFWDEVHHVKAETWTKVARHCTAYFRFGLSGTAFDPNDLYHNYKLMAACGPKLMKVSNEELIKRGISARPTIYYIRSAGKDYVADGTFAEVYKDGIVDNTERNVQILKMCKHLVCAKDHKVLLLATRHKHVQYLYRNLVRLLPKDAVVRCNYGRIPPNLRKKNLLDFRHSKRGVMIATTIYDEGMDIPEINSLMLTGGWKTFRKLLQRIGRALRKKKEGDNVVKVFDFIDWGHRFLHNHSVSRLKTCLRENFEVVGLKEAKSWVEKYGKNL